MSRIAKAPTELPSGVDVNIAGQDVTVKGKNGTLTISLNDAVAVNQTKMRSHLSHVKVHPMVGRKLVQRAQSLTTW